MKSAILITNVKVDVIPFDKRVIIEHCMLQPTSHAEAHAQRHMTQEIERRELHPFHVARQRPVLHHFDAPQMEMDREVDHYYIYADIEVQEKLGMVYEVWDNLKIEVEGYRTQVNSQAQVIRTMQREKAARKAEGWWRRVYRGMVNEL